jgi:hypothetical protein
VVVGAGDEEFRGGVGHIRVARQRKLLS